MSEILILGIETSCDETGIAIYSQERGIIAHALYSQISLHDNYGGVVPELASRDHVRKIMPLIDECLIQGGVKLSDLTAISYTQGPGLNGALLIGATVANTLAWRLGIPAIGIHHLEGHLLSPFITQPNLDKNFLALLVSGGHSQIIAVNGIGNYQILGDSLDDAAGEAFDKSAKMLGLGYPGGRIISQLAQKAKHIYPLPRPMLHSKDLMMSFSGLKTAVLTLISQQPSLDEQIIADICASVQAAICDVLVAKIKMALIQSRQKTLIVCGGVSANLQLRTQLDKLGAQLKVKIIYPPLEFCTDNGAMIAIAGYFRYRKNLDKNYAFKVFPRWDLAAQAIL